MLILALSELIFSYLGNLGPYLAHEILRWLALVLQGQGTFRVLPSCNFISLLVFAQRRSCSDTRHVVDV